MDLWKVIFIAILAWLLLGGRGLIPKNKRREAPRPSPELQQAAEESPAVAKSSAHALEPATSATAPRFAGQPASLIASINYLKSKAKSSFTIDKVRVTYYLIARSERCQVDSLETCLQDRVRTAKIDLRDFQYTYFFDRVINSGTGILAWQGQSYLVRYDKLRENNWAAIKNNYSCSGFSYRTKNAVEFINANLAKKDLFTPLSETEFPNGSTVSGQGAVDWQTLSINPADFPMSVPNEKRRAVLAQRFTASKLKAPVPRTFVVLEFANGNKYLTEASDGGSGVKQGWVDWRIGNTSPEIRYFQSLGGVAKATCFVFDDPNVTAEQVLTESKK